MNLTLIVACVVTAGVSVAGSAFLNERRIEERATALIDARVEALVDERATEIVDRRLADIDQRLAALAPVIEVAEKQLEAAAAHEARQAEEKARREACRPTQQKINAENNAGIYPLTPELRAEIDAMVEDHGCIFRGDEERF